MYIGIDLGGTNIAVGLVGESGKIKYAKSCPTKSYRTPKEIIFDMRDLVLEVIARSGIDRGQIKTIGIGIPGLADKKGNVIFCVNLGWKNVPLRKILEKELGIPVYMDNDATVAALAEYEYGAMKGAQSAVMLTLGTGIGGGIILNGKVYSGYNGVGSEIGHTVIGENYYDCNCGRNGCFETFASSTAIINYTKKLLAQENTRTLINDAIKGDTDQLNAKIIFDCAKAGDDIANIAVERLVKYIGIGIFNIVNFIDPQIIALGGGVANAGQYLLDLVIEEVMKNKYYKSLPMAKIVLAKLGNEAGIIGAAMLGKQETSSYI